MRSTDGNTDVVDCCVSTMVLPLFYSSGAVVYRKPALSVAHHLHNLFYTLFFIDTGSIMNVWGRSALAPYRIPVRRASSSRLPPRSLPYTALALAWPHHSPPPCHGPAR